MLDMSDPGSSRPEIARIDFPVRAADVTALDQWLVRRVPTHVVVLSDRRPVAFGVGAKAQEVARPIARAAGLIWIQEPFRARRP
jgi:hypothetical protein